MLLLYSSIIYRLFYCLGLMSNILLLTDFLYAFMVSMFSYIRYVLFVFVSYTLLLPLSGRDVLSLICVLLSANAGV